MALARTRQIGLKLESTAGTAETLVAADFSMEIKDHQGGRESATYERESVRGTLSRRPDARAGSSRMGSQSFAMEMSGGSAATVAKWGEAIQALGYGREAVKQIAISNTDNTESLRIGQVLGNALVQSSATKTAIFVHATADTIWILPTAGEFASSDTIYNYESTQFSADLDGNPTDGGHAFRPLSTTTAAPHKTVTIQELNDGLSYQLIAGARGTGAIMMQVNQPPTLSIEMQGPLITAGSDATAASAFVVDVPVPPVVDNCRAGTISVRMSDGTLKTPLVTQVDFTLNNNVVNRPTAGGEQVGTSGYALPMITDRTPTVSLDPEANLSDLDLHQLVLTGDLFSVESAAGTPAGANGLIKVWSPAAQLNADLEPTARDGLDSYNIEAKLTGDDDNELYVFHVFA
ncbi:MAG: hypothetical protein AAF108_02925 [Planctomycetota bacterium]